MPAAERLVILHGLDPQSIVGTGLGGRIMRYDVVAFMEKAKGSTSSQKKVSVPGSKASPVSGGVRKYSLSFLSRIALC